jgi:hypothetical protein
MFHTHVCMHMPMQKILYCLERERERERIFFTALEILGDWAMQPCNRRMYVGICQECRLRMKGAPRAWAWPLQVALTQSCIDVCMSVRAD